MTPRGQRARAWLVVLCVASGAASPAAAATITFPASGPSPPSFDLPAQPNPSLPGLSSHTFDLGALFTQGFPGLASPNLLPTGLFAENELGYFLVLLCCQTRTGFVDPLVADQTLSFLITGSYWSVFTRLELDPASGPVFANDIVTISGDAVHRVRPHPGELAPGPNVDYRVELNAGRALTLPPNVDIGGEILPIPSDLVDRLLAERRLLPGSSYGFDIGSRIHSFGRHQDLVAGILGGRVANPDIPFIARELEFYTGGTFGIHAVPEPATLALLGAGLVAVGARRPRRETDRFPPVPSAGGSWWPVSRS